MKGGYSELKRTLMNTKNDLKHCGLFAMVHEKTLDFEIDFGDILGMTILRSMLEETWLAQQGILGSTPEQPG